MQRKSLPQGRLLWQHRAIRQADSARDFSSSQGLKREGILYVFQTFQTAGLTEKIRRSAKTQLCGVALQFSQRDPRGILRTHAQRIPVEDRQQLQPRVRAGGKLAVRRKDDRLRQGGKAAAGVFEPALLRAPEVKKRRFAARAQPFGLLRREKPPRERHPPAGPVRLQVEPDRRVRERADPAPAAVRDAEVQLRRGGEPGLSLRLPGERAVRQLRRGQRRGPAQQPVRGLRPLRQRRRLDRHIRHASSGVTAVRTACTIQREAWPWPVQVTRVRIWSSAPGVSPVSSTEASCAYCRTASICAASVSAGR